MAYPFKAFSSPSQQSKSAFETKTSAINVTPSSNTRYNIREVKEDAVWLSKEVKIDEISALRIVVEECQDRPSAQLLGRLSNEELASIQEAASIIQGSTALLSRVTDADPVQDDFDSQESRRLRILRMYLSERRNLLQCLNILCQKSFYPDQEELGGRGKDTEAPVSWVRTVGKNVEHGIGDQDEWIIGGLSAIETNVGNVDAGSGWLQGHGGREDIENEWINNQIMEITYTMEVIFQIIDTKPTLCSSTVVTAWMSAMERCNFFDQFSTVRILNSSNKPGHSDVGLKLIAL